jgi:cellobiose phosphorylase
MRSLEHKAWDGKWYKRAFFDNGNPLGSHSNKEFKIDSISQSWSVLSGAAKPERSKQAMQSVLKYLFQDELLQLISPAIKNSLIDPGYIKDYPAGVRENGAQYNHAALWAAQAFARIGDSASVMRVINSVNPIKRSDSKEKVSLYRAEPYVVASDIYAKPMETGRAGWTWYTGSAGVMYRLILESILGFNISGNKLKINPCIPKDWTVFSVTYKYKNTEYNIKVFNNLSVAGAKKIKVDGVLLAGEIIDLIDDNNLHEVEVKL